MLLLFGLRNEEFEPRLTRGVEVDHRNGIAPLLEKGPAESPFRAAFCAPHDSDDFVLSNGKARVFVSYEPKGKYSRSLHGEVSLVANCNHIFASRQTCERLAV